MPKVLGFLQSLPAEDLLCGVVYIYYNGESEGYGWKKVQGAGVMKDKELKLEEI